MTETILITGGTGFIGTYLAKRFLTSGKNVKILGRKPWSSEKNSFGKSLKVLHGELSDMQLLREALEDVDTIFHKASSYLTIPGKNDEDLFHSNIKGTQSLVDALSMVPNKVQHLIFDSSISVYGEGCYSCKLCGKIRPPLRNAKSVAAHNSFELQCPNCGTSLEPIETSETELLNGSSSYAISKKVQEELLRLISERIGFDLVIFRYATVYGSDQTTKSPYARMLEKLIRGETIFLNEDGNQKRDFIHVDDVVAANIQALHAKSRGCSIINLGSGTETSLLEFSTYARQSIKEHLQKEAGKVEVTNKLHEGDVRHCKIDCANAREFLGFKPKVTLRQGLSAWVSRYKDRVTPI